MKPPPSQFDRHEREVEFARALAFSDGVFAIAITLLVLGIDVPDLSGPGLEHRLLDALADLLPSLASYCLSFAVIGLLWLRHHRLFSRIRRLDGGALWLNLLVLALVALMPFSTNVIGKYGSEPAGVGVYALNIGLAGFAYTALWLHCVRGELLGERLTGDEMRAELVLRGMIPVGFFVSIPLAFVDPWLAEACWIAILVGQRIYGRRLVGEGRVPAGDA